VLLQGADADRNVGRLRPSNRFFTFVRNQTLTDGRSPLYPISRHKHNLVPEGTIVLHYRFYDLGAV
jgi:hypothetical protein